MTSFVHLRVHTEYSLVDSLLRVDALVDAVAGWVRDHEGRQVYLWATSTNTRAIRAYTRCGFRPTGDTRPLAHTPLLSEIRMVRELNVS